MIYEHEEPVQEIEAPISIKDLKSLNNKTKEYTKERRKNNSKK